MASQIHDVPFLQKFTANINRLVQGSLILLFGQDLADQELRKLRAEVTGLINGTGITHAASTKDWQGALSNLSNKSFKKVPGGRPSTIASEIRVLPDFIKVGAGEHRTAAPTAPALQQHVGETLDTRLDEALVHHLDALAFAIVQPLKSEVQHLVSLFVGQSQTASAAVATAPTIGSANASEKSPTHVLGSPSTGPAPLHWKQQLQHQLLQDAQQTKMQSQGDKAKERARTASPMRLRPESKAVGSSRRRRAMTVAANKIILTDPATPREKFVAKPMEFDWPDSAAASRATAAAAAVRGGTVYHQRQLLGTKIDPTHQSRASSSVSNFKGWLVVGGTGQEQLEGRELQSPSSISHVQQGSPLPHPTLNKTAQTSGSSSTRSIAPATKGVRGRAEIVVASPAEQWRPATPVRRTYQRYSNSQDSPSGEDSTNRRSNCMPDKVMTSQKQQAEDAAESASATLECPKQLRCYPKSHLPETADSEDHPVRPTKLLVNQPGRFAAAAEVEQHSPVRLTVNPQLPESPGGGNLPQHKFPADTNNSIRVMETAQRFNGGSGRLKLNDMMKQVKKFI
jgi:hypothetical protein